MKQIFAITALNLRSLPERVAPSLVIVIGMAGVVAVLIAVLSVAQGLANTLSQTGSAGRALILHADAISESTSTLARDAVLTILEKPGISPDAEGRPIYSAEVLTDVNLPRKGSRTLSTLTLRGVNASQLAALRPEIQVVEGRVMRPGLHEVMAGRAAQSRFGTLQVGQTVKLNDTAWTIVGAFESGGDAHEAELFADAETMVTAYKRASFNAVTVRLTSPAAFRDLQNALLDDPTLAVTASPESTYYQSHSQVFSRTLALVAHLIGTVMAVGAIFAALNSMYSIVSSRSVEIGTLRAIGFGASAVVVSVIVEALVLAVIGALAGLALAWLIFSGNTVGTIGGAGIPNVIFQLRIGLPLIVTGVLWSLFIGLIGGLFPALRAARVPVVAALRSV
jgi:putative ABC transport system permease protein